MELLFDLSQSPEDLAIQLHAVERFFFTLICCGATGCWVNSAPLPGGAAVVWKSKSSPVRYGAASSFNAAPGMGKSITGWGRFSLSGMFQYGSCFLVKASRPRDCSSSKAARHWRGASL